MSRYREELKYNRWSEGAIKCYAIGCRCSMCEVVPEWFKKRCVMKKSVIMLVRVLGKPFNREGAVIEDSKI